MTTEQMIDAMLTKHHGDARGVIAWFIGYTGFLQADLNAIRYTLGADIRETLVECLEREAANNMLSVSGERKETDDDGR